jgi:DNA-binding NarL/FixJ family response regulator
MPEKIRVFVAEDCAPVRDALVAHIRRNGHLKLAGQVKDGKSTVEGVRTTGPDVVILGLEATPALIRVMRAASPDTRIILFSSRTDDPYLDQILATEPAGYLLKREPLERVMQAVRRVARGDTVFSEPIQTRIFELGQRAAQGVRSSARESMLTPREIEVVALLASGMSVKEAAGALSIAAKTVDNHKTQIMAKLDVHNRAELTRYAFVSGILSP